jgi:hypothetical protein
MDLSACPLNILPAALTSHARQLIAEAGLETGIDYVNADGELIFQQDLGWDTEIDHAHWDKDIDIDDKDHDDAALNSVDQGTASAIYRCVDYDVRDLLLPYLYLFC